MIKLSVDELVAQCVAALEADYQDALRCGEGTGLDELAGLITEVDGAPAGMTITETGVYSRAAMVADFESPERSEGVRGLGGDLRTWQPPGPGYLPVVVCVAGRAGVMPVRLAVKGGDA